MNDIYKNFWNPLQNFFLPNLKLIKKERIGGKIKKTYDTPKTPFDRLIECENFPENRKEALILTRDALNPIQLQSILKEKLHLFAREVEKHRSLMTEELEKRA